MASMQSSLTKSSRDELFLAAPEKDPVRHNRRHSAVGFEAGEHVLART